MKFLKFMAVAMLSLAVVGCNGNDPTDSPNEKSPFRVEVNTNYIQLGVDKAYFLVYLDDVLVEPASLIFFDAETNDIVTMNTLEVEIDGVKTAVPEWVPTKPETKHFWVAYNAYNNQKNPVSITAVDFALPDALEDPQPDNVSFVKRAFFCQFTGAGCGWCPFAKAAIYEVGAEDKYNDKFITAAIYTFDNKEMLYPTKYGNIATTFGVTGYPTILFDMSGSFSVVKDHETNKRTVRAALDNTMNQQAKAGVSVNTASDSGDTFAIMATVKAAVDGEYYVGAWLVEDGIVAKQENYGSTADIDFNTHNNVLRIADSGDNYIGHSLGAMKAGDTKDKLFVMSFEKDQLNNKGEVVKKAWVKENCRLVVFVTTKVGNRISTTNVVTNSVYNEPIAFEYAE